MWMMLIAVLGACTADPPPEPKPRSLAEARQSVLDLFSELDAFELVKQREVGLAGHSAVRMEVSWHHAGARRSGIIYVVDNPWVFNVIHYTAPSENGVFEASLPVFQKMVSSLQVIPQTGQQSVMVEGGFKVMRSPDLQLMIRFPTDWTYTIDDVNRAVVFSGPRNEPAWLSTINFSVINKWPAREP
jgi:hypothetical protein